MAKKKKTLMTAVLFNEIETVRVSWLKHSQNCHLVAQELNLPLETVQKYVKDFVNEQRADTCRFIADNITQHALHGHKSRVYHLALMLRDLEGKNSAQVSSCCKGPLVEHVYNGQVVFTCGTCQKETKPHTICDLDLMRFKAELIDRLRKDDESLIAGLHTIGHIKPSDTPVTPTTVHVTNNNNNQFNIHTGDGVVQAKPDSDDVVVDGRVKKLSELPAMKVESMIKAFESMIDAPVEKGQVIDVNTIMKAVNKKGGENVGSK